MTTGQVRIETWPVQALAALFDDGLAAPRPGDPLPPLWHWVALPTWPAAAATGADGLPRDGDLVPDAGKSRRMFAGGSAEFGSPLLVGEEVWREDRVVSTTPKHGRQGDFVLVETETRLVNVAGEVAVRETQNLVYRDGVTVEPVDAMPPASQVVGSVVARSADGSGWRFHTDPVKLMHFSAATSNPHRIHYDLPYARGVEGYPGLVVHGPLMTLALVEVLRRSGFGALGAVHHRSSSPLFCGEMATINVVRENDQATLTLESRRGVHVTVVATAR